MASKKFTVQEIERFNDRISNVLDNSDCRKVFEEFLLTQKNPTLIKTFKLWMKADENSQNSFKDDFFDIIEEIDDFNMSPLLSVSECDQKFAFVKQECSRILEKIRPQFIHYLHKYHQ